VHKANVTDGKSWPRIFLRADPIMSDYLTSGKKSRIALLSSSLKVMIVLKVNSDHFLCCFSVWTMLFFFIEAMHDYTLYKIDRKLLFFDDSSKIRSLMILFLQATREYERGQFEVSDFAKKNTRDKKVQPGIVGTNRKKIGSRTLGKKLRILPFKPKPHVND
jgi:hypothetical protein